MVNEKIDLKILKIMIFELAGSNGISLSNLATKRKLDYVIVDEQSNFLIDMGLLEYAGTSHTEKDQKGESLIVVQLKKDLKTLQKIANFLDNKELSLFMRTKYYRNNIESYCVNLLNSMNEHNLTPLPDVEYLEYAIKNSPSNVRFFLVNNDIKALESFYQRCISDTHDRFKDRIKIDLFKKYNLYIIWENIIFGKIQEDLQNKVLLDPVNYFAGYLPLAKRTFEKLLEISNSKEEIEKFHFLIKNYLKVLLT